MSTKYKGQVLPEKFDYNVMTDANSLTANLNKMPAISKIIIDKHKQHTLTWLTEKTSRFAKEEIKDQAFRWKLRGQITKPAVTNGYAKWDGLSAGTADIPAIVGDPTTLATDDLFTIIFKHDHANALYGTELNPNDQVKFESGGTAIVLDYPRKVDALNLVKYDMKFIGGDIVNTDISDDNVVGFIGSAYGEGSEGGYMNNQYSDWYIQYTTINRAAAKITGTAAINVEWISDGSNYAFWYFEQERINEEKFFRGLELQRRYARTSMDNSTGNDIMGGSGTNLLTKTNFNANSGITAPQVGDGLYPQFEDANNRSYDIAVGLAKAQIEEFIATLAQNALMGAGEKKEWLVLAGSIGRIEWQGIMEKLVVSTSPGGSFTDMNTGKDMALGTNFTTFYYLNHKITVVHDETLDDPALNRSQNGLTGKGDLIFLDFAEANGVANIEIKSAYSRSFIKKYLNGMHSFNGKSESYAVSGYDGAGVEILAESATVLRTPTSCGMITQTGTRATAWA